ncbi:MAG TPA: glycosyltransferase family 39 protein, partial [Anaeromyxobacteraceae bacterium]
MAAPVPAARARARPGLVWAVAAAAAALGVHLACGNRYGVFRDELYFLACGRHLSWGYVDQPPLIALVARATSAVLGTSPLGLRLPAYAAHACTILAVAALARRLGGRGFAVGLSALATLGAPVSLGAGHLLTMNAFEPLLWAALALAVLRAVEGEPRGGWLAAGALVGLGLLNKYGMAFWAVALLAGLAVSSARRALASPWLAAAIALAVALALPNVLWQAAHGFPMLELLRNGQLDKNAPFTWRAFAGETLLEQNPVAAPLWAGGLAWLLLSGGGGRRWLGFAFLAAAAEIAGLSGKAYYLAPAFPVLWAAGGCAAEWALRRAAARAAVVAALAGTAAIVAPIAVPLLPLPALAAWQARLGVKPDVGERETTGVLSQSYADQTGWPELV